jgi:hypothetical protein
VGGGPTIVVNFDALAELTSRLQNIHRTFTSMGADPAIDGAALGDARLSDALERFLDGWSQGRQQIGSSLSAIVVIVAHAVETYEQADKSIASAEQGIDSGSTAGSGTSSSQGQTHE